NLVALDDQDLTVHGGVALVRATGRELVAHLSLFISNRALAFAQDLEVLEGAGSFFLERLEVIRDSQRPFGEGHHVQARPEAVRLGLAKNAEGPMVRLHVPALGGPKRNGEVRIRQAIRQTVLRPYDQARSSFASALACAGSRLTRPRRCQR